MTERLPLSKPFVSRHCNRRLLVIVALVVSTGAPAPAQLPDRDGDGVADDVDDCPDVADRDQLDRDGDRLGDACDNCIAVFNPDQTDVNGDHTGDACEDGDGDGVANGEDLCPATPARAAALGLGCGTLDLVRPSTLIATVQVVLDGAAAQLGSDPELGRVAGKVTAAHGALAPAECALPEGKLCRGAAMVRRAGRHLAQAEQALARVMTKASARLASPSFGDVSPRDLRVATLNDRQELLAGASAAARGVGAVLDAGCAALGGKRTIRGVVASIDDAARLLTLADGTMLALPTRRYDSGLAVGREVKAHVKDLGSDSALALGIDAGKTGSAALGPQCLALRVAPIQRFPPHFPGPYVLHALDAYRGESGDLQDVLLLEQGMRLAAQDVACSDPIPPGFSSVRHSLSVSLQCGPVGLTALLIGSSKGPLQTMAPDLTPDDGLIDLPCCDSGTLTVQERRMACRDLATGKTICDPPENVGPAQKAQFLTRARNAYCTAQYEQTEFSIDDEDPSLHIARVNALALHASVPQAPLADAFRAEGYAVVPFLIPVTTYPTAVDIATVSAPYEPLAFAIYNQFAAGHDFFQEPSGTNFIQAFQFLQQLALTGVDRPAGLRWPHVRGTRGGAEFWYSCALPLVVRDVLQFCIPPNGFYRWPFTASAPVDTSGVCGHPGLGHCGYGDPVDPTCSCGQRDAYDVGNPLGTPIHAARGGLVVRAVGDQIANTWNCCPAEAGQKQCGDEADTFTQCVEGSDPFCTCWCRNPAPTLVDNQPRGCTIGNYLWIRHSDRTIGVYFHMQSSAAGPAIAVKVGDRVRRGQLIGRVGNTGNSTDPHTHFEESPPAGGLDNLMHFEITRGVCQGTCTPCLRTADCLGMACVCNPSCTPVIAACYIPEPGDTLCAP